MKLDLANISEKEVDIAYNLLADTEQECAQLYAAKDALKRRIGIAEAQQFLLSQAGTVAERRAEAESSADALAYVEDWENATADYKLLEYKRERALETIKLWAIMSANRRGK